LRPRSFDPCRYQCLERADQSEGASSGSRLDRSKLELPGAAHKREYLQAWLTGLEARFYGQTLRFGVESAHHFGRIAARPEVKARQPQIIDMLLAAQAQEHGIPLATRNARDFDWIGIELIDPWEA
jgi:toxin FitB